MEELRLGLDGIEKLYERLSKDSDFPFPDYQVHKRVPKKLGHSNIKVMSISVEVYL